MPTPRDRLLRRIEASKRGACVVSAQDLAWAMRRIQELETGAVTNLEDATLIRKGILAFESRSNTQWAAFERLVTALDLVVEKAKQRQGS